MQKEELYTEIGIRIEEFRRELGENKRDFSVRLKIDASSYNMYLRGELKPDRLFYGLIQAGADLEYIKTGVRSGTKPLIPLQQILVFSSMKAAESNAVHEGTSTRYIAIPQSQDQTLFAVTVTDNSMHNNFKQGDIVILSKQQPPQDGKPCAVLTISGEEYIRYLHRNGSAIILTADDSSLPPITIPMAQIKSLYKVTAAYKTY